MGGGGPLDGISVSVTGITLEEMDVIKNDVESLGGKFSGFLDEETTCLIATKAGSEKHRAACTHFNIPVVVMQWLEDCNSSGELMQFENYEVPTFHGLTICCTQVSIEERYTLQRKLEQHGAIYNSDLLEDECTHLIAITAEGDKYTAAKTWGNVHIVSMDWVEESIRKGRSVPEQPYLVLPLVNGTRANASTVASRDQKVEATAAATGEREDRDDASSGPPPGVEWDKLPTVGLVRHDQSQVLQEDVFFISGFNAEQTDYLIQMIMAGGGRRHFVLSMSVTKVFLGPEANEKLIVDVCKHPCGAKCVMVEWLVKTLVPDYSVDDGVDDEQNDMETADSRHSQGNEERNSLDRFEHEMTTTTDAEGARQSSTSSSRTQRRRSLASSSVNAPSSGLKRIASEVAKERDPSYTSIRRRHSSSKNLTKESQFIDWSHE